MAIQTSTLTVTGKIGNFVGRKGKGGRYVAAKYQPVVANPRTVNQVTYRGKFSAVAKLSSSLAGWAKKMCKGITKYGTDYSNIMALNPPSVVAVQQQGTDNFVIDFTKLKLSSGAIQLPYNIVANVDGNDIVVTWTDNSGMGNAEGIDEVCTVLFNTNKDNTAIYNIAAGKRVDTTVSISVPTSWSSDTLHAFIAFRRDDGSVSASQYLGSFTV